ncbi:GL20496 [Drosophila persimilis]|uniref:GL20496 n=1 Tax=Drosophila persimilis TaxID=7234 RepID=B4H0N5_DROPE|nr:GL20496 [Drosophila persimilis]
MARNSLFEHLKLHYSNEEFKCDICGKTFKSTKNLQNHKQIHDKVKRYVCQICGSAFAQAAGLYLHKRRHNRPNGAVGAVARSGRSTLKRGTRAGS